MIRSSVDLPQPDGPIRETNSPGSTSRSMPSSAVTPALNCFETPLSETRFHATCSGARFRISRSSRTTARKNMMPSSAQATIVAHEIRGLGRVVLVEVHDRVAEPALERRGSLADDRADHARGRRDLQRREDVGQRGGHAKPPEDLPAARRVRAHQLERARIRRVQSAERVDRDGEEREVRRDHRDRDPRLHAFRPEPERRPSARSRGSARSATRRCTAGGRAAARVECASTTASRKPITAPSAKPASASLPVKSE